MDTATTELRLVAPPLAVADILDGTISIVTALAESGSLRPNEVGDSILLVSEALKAVASALPVDVPVDLPAGAATQREAEPRRPAVPIKTSVTDNHIVSLIDGREYKSLKRHLTKNGFTPQSYRAAFGLPADYPMVAKNYSERRAELAKSMGLGRKPILKAAA